MRKRENWLFGFAALGAMAALTTILQYFGILPVRRGSAPMSIAHSDTVLLWGAVALALLSLFISGYGFYVANRRTKASVSGSNGSTPQVGFNGALDFAVHRHNAAPEFVFQTNGGAIREVSLGFKPSKIRLESPVQREIEEQDLSVDIPVEGGCISFNAFSDTGIVLNERGLTGIQVRGYVLLSAPSKGK